MREGFQLDLAQAAYRAAVVGLGGLGVAIMVAPVAIGLIVSLTAGETLRFPPAGLSLRWYAALLDPLASGPLQLAALNSLEIAALAVLGTLAVAVPAAVGATRLRRRSALGVEAALLAPLVLPSLVYGLAALIGATLVGLSPSRALVVVGHVVVFAPLVYRATIAVASSLDPSLAEASASLGASAGRTFLRILLPLLAPGIAAGAFLVFMTSLDNISISLFLADPRTSVLPMRLWQMIEESLDVRVAAVSGVLIAATLVLLLLVQRLAPLLRDRIAS